MIRIVVIFFCMCLPQMAAEFRVAVFNAALYRDQAGVLIRDCQDANHSKVAAVANVIRDVNADVILINEFDYDAEGFAAKAFAEIHLKGAYPHWFIGPVNTGVASGEDLNHDGDTTDPEDSFGFGKHPGQYGMLLLSRYPIDRKNVRTFQQFLWQNMPGNLLPKAHYGTATAKLRLSSKSHWDVPILLDGKTLHCLCSHPTPPAFDDGTIKDLSLEKPVDWNGRRNHDEIQFWARYIDVTEKPWMIDDQGKVGGLAASSPQGIESAFVILGDLNADPDDGDSVNGQMGRLLQHPQVLDCPAPKSIGALKRVKKSLQNRDTKTSDFGLRCDYVLPSKCQLVWKASAVHWPEDDAIVRKASDHRAVWCDLSWTQSKENNDKPKEP